MTPTEYNTAVDRIIKNSLTAHGALVPCCKKGCSHCCYEPACTDRRVIDHIIAGMTPEQIEEVKARLPAWLEKTAEARKLERPKVHDYRDLNVACPLLKDGLCSVYDRRPLDCRIWFAIGNPDDCAMPARKHQKFTEYTDEAMSKLCEPWVLSTLVMEGEVVMDHIGVLLAERLLNIKVESAARRHLKYEDVGNE